METVYEAWVQRGSKKSTEDVVVTDPKTKEQRVEKKPIEIPSGVTEALLDEDQAPIQSTDKGYIEKVANMALANEEDNVLKAFIRETRTVSEFVKQEQPAS